MSDDDLTDDATIPFYSPNQPPDTAAAAEDGAGSTRGRDGTRGVMSDDKRRQRVRACVPGVFSDSVSRKRTPMGVPRREIAMHDTVAQIIRKWLGQFEGPVREMYIDNRGLVTTGTGNLLQSAREANTYQWERIAGGAASPPEVAAEFERVRSAETKRKIPGWAVMGGGNFIKSAMKLGIVTLRLTADSVDKMFQDKLNGLEATMKGTPGYEEYEDFPGDAQIGILSVIWANGAGGFVDKRDLRLHKTWPGFTGACERRAWAEIADKPHYRWKNIRDDRDKATARVFRNAEIVENDENAPQSTVLERVP